MGDFNIPHIYQFLYLEGKLIGSLTLGHLQALIDYHNLILTHKEPTKGNEILDFVIVTSSLSQSSVRQLPPIGVSNQII